MHREEEGDRECGTLYVVATPIGNLRDITLRALDVLREVGTIAAEDTRVTRVLLSHYGISARLISLHEHNERDRVDQLAHLLRTGQDVALVSDAGTPAVSDPGARLVRELRGRGFLVVPIPGPSATIAALSASGEESPHFLFYGFLPPKAAARRKALQKLRSLPWTLVFFEAPHRVADCIQDLSQLFGGARRVCVARELTKLHETIHAGALADAPAWLAGPHQEKGEFVLVVGAAEALPEDSGDESERVLRLLLQELPVSRAADLAAKITGRNRKTLYRRALDFREDPGT